MRVEAKPGASVAAHAPVVILISMKMEFEVKTPKAGIVRSVRVKEGDVVQKGDVLAVVADGTSVANIRRL